MQTISPTWIGRTALNTLAKLDEASVIGVSSRGVFLQTSSGWVVFLSGECFRGPLAVNLPAESGFFDILHKSDYAQTSEGAIQFSGLAIPFRDAPLWDPPLLASRPDKKARKALIETVKNLEDPLFTRLIDRHSIQPSLHIEIKVLDLVDRMNFGDWAAVTDLTKSLLGLGGGLTPEGDDFLIGLAFSMYQMFADDLPEQVETWISQLQPEAERATTTISANLLACAANGQADERLYNAFRALCLGEENAEEAVQELLGWGNSSGRMALAGIAAGLRWG